MRALCGALAAVQDLDFFGDSGTRIQPNLVKVGPGVPFNYVHFGFAARL